MPDKEIIHFQRTDMFCSVLNTILRSLSNFFDPERNFSEIWKTRGSIWQSKTEAITHGYPVTYFRFQSFTFNDLLWLSTSISVLFAQNKWMNAPYNIHNFRNTLYEFMHVEMFAKLNIIVQIFSIINNLYHDIKYCVKFGGE